MKENFKILLSPDSFKESMTAKEVCEAMERGIKKVDYNVDCIFAPMADGGEGTMETLVDATGGRMYSEIVIDPLGNEVEARYGILGDGETGIIEMATASGLHLVPLKDRNPMITTSYGTGQLIKACLDKQVSKLVLAIGGSATNDGGIGAIQALGGSFLDIEGKELGYGGGELGKLATIDLSKLDPRIKHISIEIACDVDNPLYGEYGASKVFGPQKGASKESIDLLDSNLKHYADKIKEYLQIDIAHIPGAGAAGGMGAGLMAFLNGKMERGIELVIKHSKLEEKVAHADMVWIGEGRMDSQTQYGKAPIGIAKLAKKYNKPVIALVGSIGKDVDILYSMGVDSIFSILSEIGTLEGALVSGQVNMEKTAENIMRLIKIME